MNPTNSTNWVMLSPVDPAVYREFTNIKSIDDVFTLNDDKIEDYLSTVSVQEFKRHYRCRATTALHPHKKAILIKVLTLITEKLQKVIGYLQQC